MVCPRTLAATGLLASLIVPSQVGGIVPQVAHAATPVVWHLDRATFDPGTGQASGNPNIHRASAVYLVEVELSSTDSGDEAYVQLGTNQGDVTQVQSGEDRFFVASNLTPGAVPAFRIIADPKHHYAGRTVTYAVAVYSVPPTGTDISGVAMSAVPNVVAFSTPRAATYTVQYHLAGGTGRLIIINGTGATVKDFGSVTGDGAAMVALPAGTFALGLEQAPKGSAISWTLHIGLAPRVGMMSPPDRAQLQHSPSMLWAATEHDSRLVLDNRTVAATYDATSGHLVYHPETPLAPGLHQIAVVSPDGTQATAVSHFLVLPQTTTATPATSPGEATLVHTTTPEGRYRLLKPVSWQMAGSAGTIYLVAPHGKALLMLSERYLGQAVDAGTIARTIGDKLGSKYGLVGAWSYGGSAASATFRGTLRGSGHAGSLTMVGRVLPSLDRHSLLIAYGFGQGAPDAATLTSIESSLAPNDDAGIVAARPMLRYAADVVALQYPADWLANFTNTQGSWFVGPNDQAVLIAAGIPVGNVTIDSQALQAIGRQVQGYIRAQIHAKFQVVQEQAAAGRYLWLATFSSPGGQMDGVEVGEIVAHNGQFVALYGDTTLDQAPTNLPLFARSLDSAARAAGVTAGGAYTIDDVATALRHYTAAANSNGSTAASGATGASRASSYLTPYKRYLNEQSAYQSVLDSSYGMYAARMNVGSTFGGSGVSYTYTSSTW